MGCIDAYREALMRDLSSTAPAAETDPESGTAMALAADSTGVNKDSPAGWDSCQGKLPCAS
jgi:hypothetical protein